MHTNHQMYKMYFDARVYECLCRFFEGQLESKKKRKNMIKLNIRNTVVE